MKVVILIAIVALFGLSSCQKDNDVVPVEAFCWECEYEFYSDDYDTITNSGGWGMSKEEVCNMSEKQIQKYMNDWMKAENGNMNLNKEVNCIKYTN